MNPERSNKSEIYADLQTSRTSYGMNSSGSNRIILKRNPIVIVKRFIFFEIIGITAFILATSLAHYAQIYRSLIIAHYVSFRIAEGVFIIGAETILLFLIFASWYREFFVFEQNKITHGQGIYFRKEVSVPLANIESVSYRQGPIAKILRYGTILISNKQMIMKIKDIPEPQINIEIILNLKKSLPSNSGRLMLPTSEELLLQPEHHQLEFKSTFRWDLKENKVNKNLEKSAMKTVAAFLNSSGGHLIIGIDDKRNIVGLNHDYATLGRQDSDGFENHFTHIFNNMIGPEFRHHIQLQIHKKTDKEFCIISAIPSHAPVYLKSENGEEFFIRTGNNTTAMTMSAASNYINTRFH